MFAVAETVASPEAFVVVGEPVIAADAPEPGGANVTVAPETGLPLASFTRATSGDANAVVTAVVCPLPLLTVIEAAAPAVLVSENEAGVATPGVDALTE